MKHNSSKMSKLNKKLQMIIKMNKIMKKKNKRFLMKHNNNKMKKSKKKLWLTIKINKIKIKHNNKTNHILMDFLSLLLNNIKKDRMF